MPWLSLARLSVLPVAVAGPTAASAALPERAVVALEPAVEVVAAAAEPVVDVLAAAVLEELLQAARATASATMPTARPSRCVRLSMRWCTHVGADRIAAAWDRPGDGQRRRATRVTLSATRPGACQGRSMSQERPR